MIILNFIKFGLESVLIVKKEEEYLGQRKLGHSSKSEKYNVVLNLNAFYRFLPFSYFSALFLNSGSRVGADVEKARSFVSII